MRRTAAAIVPRRQLRQQSVAGQGDDVPENAGVQSNFWYQPAAPNANDQEFNAVTKPANLAWWVGTVGAMVAATNGGDVNVLTTLAAAASYRASYSPTGRKSWLALQASTDASIYAALTPLTGVVANMLFRARLSEVLQIANSINNNGELFLSVMAAVAGAPDLANRVDIGYEINPDGAANPAAGHLPVGRTVIATVASGTSQLGNVRSANTPNASITAVPLADSEFVLLKQGTTWYFFVHTSAGFTYLGSKVSAITPAFVGVWTQQAAGGDTEPASPIVCVDYVRVENNPAFVP